MKKQVTSIFDSIKAICKNIKKLIANEWYYFIGIVFSILMILGWFKGEDIGLPFIGLWSCIIIIEIKHAMEVVSKLIVDKEDIEWLKKNIENEEAE